MDEFLHLMFVDHQKCCKKELCLVEPINDIKEIASHLHIQGGSSTIFTATFDHDRVILVQLPPLSSCCILG